ncbi:hypothetical protein CJ999_31535 [Bacillus thuringiensis]|nr:hypothetical protein AC241_27610 [Bacillus thuringiensis]MBZ8125884.1 hypothetical protein [Bacillus thuringiensis]
MAEALLTGIVFFITRTNKLIIAYTVLSLNQGIIFSEQRNHIFFSDSFIIQYKVNNLFKI